MSGLVCLGRPRRSGGRFTYTGCQGGWTVYLGLCDVHVVSSFATTWCFWSVPKGWMPELRASVEHDDTDHIWWRHPLNAACTCCRGSFVKAGVPGGSDFALPAGCPGPARGTWWLSSR
jgi:hypothetical protein